MREKRSDQWLDKKKLRRRKREGKGGGYRWAEMELYRGKKRENRRLRGGLTLSFVTQVVLSISFSVKGGGDGGCRALDVIHPSLETLQSSS